MVHFWLYMLMLINFNDINKIEARYKVLRINMKLSEVLLLSLRATIASSLFANITFTHVPT